MRLEYFELVDRIVDLDLAAGTVAADCVLPAQSPVFEGHFPGHPILPGVLMIEAMAQTGGWLVMGKLRYRRMCFLAAVQEAKLRSFLAPSAPIRVEATLAYEGSGYADIAGRILSDGKRIADAKIRYIITDFPNETLRASMLAAARRVGVPEALLVDA
jgi:3-hydroxyacyl-[acyl-carrier-protein] dehydratase